MRKLAVFFPGILLGLSICSAQVPQKLSSSEVYHSLEKLNFLGTALYIAAHPDDENTRLISYLSNELKARTGYLSITRGDGGQNLIGSELRELLGVLRTQELLAARKIDGGEQFFTRASDFGYSKHSDETLKIWDKKAILGDVVRIIRKFKPDVIINRFDHRSPGETHGHHTSSAMLSIEAFALSNDNSSYPEQLTATDIWQPKRLFFNTSWWFYGSEENFEKADKSKMLRFDVGTYYPLLGLSNNEIASLASSQHLSQGFGRITSRGSENEYIELLKGDLPEDGELFEGINTSWSRITGGEAIGQILYGIEKDFNFTDPSVHLPKFLEAYKLIQGLGDSHWKQLKSEELENLILSVTGLYLEATASLPYTNPGNTEKIQIEALNRSNRPMTLNSVILTPESDVKNDGERHVLEENKKITLELDLKIPSEHAYTSPYWLSEKGSLGMYEVADANLIGQAETPKSFNAVFNLDINGTVVSISKPVVYKTSKPDKGELYEPFDVLPEATSRFIDKVMLFADDAPRKIPVIIRSNADNIKGQVELKVADGWKVSPSANTFEIANKGDETTVMFTLSPPSMESESYIRPVLSVNGKELTHELINISYDHIPRQSILLPSEAKIVRMNISKAGEHIGYIMGAGDEVPESLKQIGYTVHIVDPATIQAGSLSAYDAVVVGIRAYNVIDELKFKQSFLLDYVKNGGNLVVQYNTAGRWAGQFEGIAPFPLTLSNERVTDENSNVEILAKNHSLVNFPNSIGKKDFEGWVQERGLYFPNEWDPAFTPILSMADTGATALNGSLLVAPYGKGNYIYTGLSFFRELPAGVPGAYKLFANMLSMGKEKVNKETDIKG